jgi:hypothetical protein
MAQGRYFLKTDSPEHGIYPKIYLITAYFYFVEVIKANKSCLFNKRE